MLVHGGRKSLRLHGDFPTAAADGAGSLCDCFTDSLPLQSLGVLLGWALTPSERTQTTVAPQAGSKEHSPVLVLVCWVFGFRLFGFFWFWFCPAVYTLLSSCRRMRRSQKTVYQMCLAMNMPGSFWLTLRLKDCGCPWGERSRLCSVGVANGMAIEQATKNALSLSKATKS